MTQFTVLYAGRQGPKGNPGEGEPGPMGPGFRARNEWGSGNTYAPGDAVSADSSAVTGIKSLFVQKASAPESVSLLPPRSDAIRWLEIGAFDLSNVTGAIWRVYQLAHGFTQVGTPIGYSVTADRWVGASSKVGSEVGVGVIREVVSANEFIVQTSGEITGLDPTVIWPSGTTEFIAGRFYYVDPVRGRLTLEPSPPSPGFASNAILLATGPTDGVVLQWQQTPNVIGRRPVGYADFHFTATAGQTVFTGMDLDDAELSYEVSDQTEVYVDGVRISARDGFTATTGTSVTLASPLSAGQAVTIRVLREPLAAIAPATALQVDNIAPLFDGVRRRFPFTVGGGDPIALGLASNFLIWLDGNAQEPFADYTVIAGETTTSDIEFPEAPSAGARFWGLAGVAVSNLSFLQVDTLIGETITAETLNFTEGFGDTLAVNEVTAGSATIAGAMAAGSVSVTGEMAAGSATVTGEMAAGSATVTGVAEAGVLRSAELRGPDAGGNIVAFDLVVDEGVF